MLLTVLHQVKSIMQSKRHTPFSYVLILTHHQNLMWSSCLVCVCMFVYLYAFEDVRWRKTNIRRHCSQRLWLQQNQPPKADHQNTEWLCQGKLSAPRLQTGVSVSSKGVYWILNKVYFVCMWKCVFVCIHVLCVSWSWCQISAEIEQQQIQASFLRAVIFSKE